MIWFLLFMTLWNTVAIWMIAFMYRRHHHGGFTKGNTLSYQKIIKESDGKKREAPGDFMP